MSLFYKNHTVSSFFLSSVSVFCNTSLIFYTQLCKNISKIVFYTSFCYTESKENAFFLKKGLPVTEYDNPAAGAFPAQKKDGTSYYRSSFTYKNKHISLGSFQTKEEAHGAYLEAHQLISDVSLQLMDYSRKQYLSFEKWVILCNFRDNNLYFSTPIYVRKHYFSYYLDEHTELKFSIDDLFYYASHKIMQRGGHYFVADYGMQVNILSRYGIKNYGVRGVDYNLINNDPYDFRYENVEILNSYHGVRLTTYRRKEKYQARIHVKGYYIIGYYDSPVHAAIAYNKAIDTLQAKGCPKQFRPNYIEGISPSAYAQIYRTITMPDKIIQF